MAKAQTLASADRKNVEAVLPTYAKIDAATAAALALPAYSPAAPGATQLQRLADLMLQQHLITSAIDVHDVIFTP